MGTDSLESISELPFYRGLRKGHSPSHTAGKQVAELGFRPSSGFQPLCDCGKSLPRLDLAFHLCEWLQGLGCCEDGWDSKMLSQVGHKESTMAGVQVPLAFPHPLTGSRLSPQCPPPA